MSRVTLNNIFVSPISRIETPGGDVLHAIRKSDPGYHGFGEAYFSWIEYGVVKAWKQHTRMTMNLVVPVGQVRFKFRIENSKELRIEEAGLSSYVRITVPPGIWFAFEGLAHPSSLILNIANIVHDPNEVNRLDINI